MNGILTEMFQKYCGKNNGSKLEIDDFIIAI